MARVLWDGYTTCYLHVKWKSCIFRDHDMKLYNIMKLSEFLIKVLLGQILMPFFEYASILCLVESFTEAVLQDL